MLKKDSIVFGALIGILLPFIIYAIIFYILKLFSTVQFENNLVIELISIGLNAIPLRYYFINLKYEKTGRGILLVTFLMIILFFSIR